MKAIELANELDKLWDKSFRNPIISKSAEMLQKQAKEIEELKQIVESTIKQAFYEDDYYKLKAEYDLLKTDLEVKKASEK